MITKEGDTVIRVDNDSRINWTHLQRVRLARLLQLTNPAFGTALPVDQELPVPETLVSRGTAALVLNDRSALVGV